MLAITLLFLQMFNSALSLQLLTFSNSKILPNFSLMMLYYIISRSQFLKNCCNAYLLTKVGADTAENEPHFARVLTIVFCQSHTQQHAQYKLLPNAADPLSKRRSMLPRQRTKPKCFTILNNSIEHLRSEIWT